MADSEDGKRGDKVGGGGGGGGGGKGRESVGDHDGPDSGRSTSTRSASSPTLLRPATTPLYSDLSSAATSAKPSREGSPIRQLANSRPTLGTHSPSRSRENSTDRSPIRAPNSSNTNLPSIPSAAAIQRALSAAGAQHPSGSSGTEDKDVARVQRGGKPSSASTPKTAPVTRLNSPPPPPSAPSAGSNRPIANISRKADHLQGNPVIPTLNTPSVDHGMQDEPTKHRSGTRTPTRNTSAAGAPLETVEENSAPSTPSEETPQHRNEHPAQAPMERSETSTKEQKQSIEGTSSTADGKKKVEDEVPSAWQPSTSTTGTSAKTPAIHPRQSYSNIPGKLKSAAEGATKTMTVETETVSSVPQVAVGGGASERKGPGRTDTSSSLRPKASTETIRPKKERKKAVRKTTSLNSGAASSKADIFEAKVASAVGEADSSDTEETFVYESSPPEMPSRKVHSRTPSTASTFSQADPYGVKHRQESQQALAKKRSMKFATNYNTMGNDGDGTIRSSSAHAAGRGNTPHHHHHIGRYGRNGHGSIRDKETSAGGPKTPRSAASLQQFAAQPAHQRSPNVMRLGHSSRKTEEGLSYDLEGEGADDERAPLIGSVRSGRNRRRPLPGSVRQVYASDDRPHRHCGRVTAFASLGSLLAVLIAAIVIILILCTKPLEDVKVMDIRNVLASESEIMLDLSVRAINPNIVAITVSDLDLNLFAKSRYIKPIVEPSPSTGTSTSSNRLRARREHQLSSGDLYTTGPAFSSGKDEGTDPMPYPEDPSSDTQTMLLGPIYKFDSPLIFEASPLHHRISLSSGEIRLSRPGNKTEDGGSARWERVLQHDFELIVRGVMKYSLPISSRTRSASIGGKIVVHPNEDDDSKDNKGGMRLTHPRPKKGLDDGSNVVIEPPQLPEQP